MINWLIIGVLVLAGLYIIKLQHFGKKVKLIVVVIILTLIYLSATTLLSLNNIELNSVQGVGKATYLYFIWIKDTSVSLWHTGGEVVTIIGNAIKLNQTEEYTKDNFKERFKNSLER